MVILLIKINIYCTFKIFFQPIRPNWFSILDLFRKFRGKFSFFLSEAYIVFVIAFISSRPQVSIRRYTRYLSVFSSNAGKYGPEQLRIQTLFTQCNEVSISLVKWLPAITSSNSAQSATFLVIGPK